MKIVKVTYTTKPEFAEKNQSNIRAVMTDLEKLNNPGINYNSCLSADGKTFIHTAFFNSEEEEKVLFALPSFGHFQQELRGSGLEVPPKQELLTLVASSTPILSAIN